MTKALDERALTYACQRVEDFARVNETRSPDERDQAIDIWLESLGLDEALRNQLTGWFERFVGPGWDGAAMVGFAVGLFLNQYYLEHPRPE